MPEAAPGRARVWCSSHAELPVQCVWLRSGTARPKYVLCIGSVRIDASYAAVFEFLSTSHQWRCSVAGHRRRTVGAVQALISPTTQMGRQLAHVLLLLRRHLSADVEMLLSPAVDLDAMPLTAYYAYAAPEVPAEAATEPVPVVASLARIPGHMVLTLNVEAPEAWLVEVPLSTSIPHAAVAVQCIPSASPVAGKTSWIESSRTGHRSVRGWLCWCCLRIKAAVLQVAEAELDVDNLRADALGDEPRLHVQLRLEAIMFTGSCIDAAYETSQDAYPRGVQLVLGSNARPHLQDTLVMANLGYFQLKTQPGVAVVP